MVQPIKNIETNPLADRGGGGDMFDRIARRYDLLNRVMSLGMDRYWRWRMIRALQLPARARVLDVATGTGDVALQILRHRPAASVTGLDPSQGMLDVGEQKKQRTSHGDQLELVQGDAQSMPFADNYFDACCIAFGIRNVPDRRLGLSEMSRVTKPGGRVAVLELGEPSIGPLAPFARFYVHRIVPKLGAWLSGAAEYDYLQASIAAFPSAADFAALMEDTGKTSVDVKPLAFGACNLYVGVVPG